MSDYPQSVLIKDKMEMLEKEVELLGSFVLSINKIMSSLQPLVSDLVSEFNRSVTEIKLNPEDPNPQKTLETITRETIDKHTSEPIQTDDKTASVENTEHRKVNKEDIDKLLTYAKSVAKHKLQTESQAALDKIEHLSNSTITEPEASESVKPIDSKFNYTRHLIERIFSNSIISKGKGKIVSNDNLKNYDNDLRKTDIMDVIRYPSGFYRSSEDGSLQFLLNARDSASKLFLFLGLDTNDPSMLLVSFEKDHHSVKKIDPYQPNSEIFSTVEEIIAQLN